MRPVTPCYIEIGACMVTPSYDVIKFWHLMILLFSSVSAYKTKMSIMPTFTPNDYMLRKFSPKVKDAEYGKDPEPWEVYAWCVRDAMAKRSGMAVSDMPLSKKLEFEDFMNYRRHTIEHNKVVYRPRQSHSKSITEPLL